MDSTEAEETQSDCNSVIERTADRPILCTHSSPPQPTKLIADQSIEAALQQGAALRKQKRLSFHPMSTSLQLVSGEDRFTKKYRSNNRCPPRKTLSQKKACNSKTCIAFDADGSHIARSTSSSYVTRPVFSKANISVSTGSGRRPRRCPLRIAELAVPSKRHCIDTWRDRNAMLPAHMLERLKQNVMNQKILATIPDAENCFKIRKNNRAVKVSPHTHSGCRIPKNRQRESQEMADVRLMSAVFAHRVAEELVKPMNVYLPEESMNLVQNVSNEIKGLIQNRRVCADYVYDTDLLKEMSGKITLWISDILACAEYKMLEDELRVVKTEQNKISKEGNLVTLIDQYVRWQMEGDQDLEEEEGPALDALDLLLDNVLDICRPKNIFNEDEDTAEQNNEQFMPKVGDESEFQNEDRDNEDQNSQVTKTADNVSNISEVYDNTSNHHNKGISEDGSESEYGSPEEIRSNASVADNSDTEGNTKVSDDDEPLDGRKSVKFTREGQRGDGTGGNGESGSYRGSESGGNGRPITNESLSRWPNYSRSATFIRSDIVFQSPNNNILSAVDEPWPDENNLTLRPSAIALRSVASLGDIKETDDDESDPNDGHYKHKNDKGFFDDTDYEIKINEEKQIAINVSPSNRSFSKTQKDNEYYTMTDSQRTHSPEQNIRLNITPSKLLKDLHKLVTEEVEKTKDIQINQVNYKGDATDGKGDRNDTQKEYLDTDTTDAEKNLIQQSIRRKLRPENKFDYRVNPQTAPAWAIFSPSSEDSFQLTRKKMCLGSSGLRKWCKELENILTHLTHWNRWLNSICRDIEYLQTETDSSKKLGRRHVKLVLKDWSGFKKNLDKDAIFWRKLHQKTCKALNKYPTGLELLPQQNFTPRLTPTERVVCNCQTIPQSKNWQCTRKLPRHRQE